MTINEIEYASAMYRCRMPAPQKSKRERAADLIDEGRRLALEALDEEDRELALDAEYGPKIKPANHKD
jgi:hypothetical protein